MPLATCQSSPGTWYINVEFRHPGGERCRELRDTVVSWSSRRSDFRVSETLIRLRMPCLFFVFAFGFALVRFSKFLRFPTLLHIIADRKGCESETPTVSADA
eukprot:2970060-Pleurochrysis_carterae.AAC.1